MKQSRRFRFVAGLVPGIFSRALEIDSVDERDALCGRGKKDLHDPCDNRSMQG